MSLIYKNFFFYLSNLPPALFFIDVFLQIADTVFKLTQLSAKKNNVRPTTSWMMTLLKEKVTNKELDVSQLTATPFYNLAIFEDIVLHTLQKILTKAILPYDTTIIRQAIVLFQVKVVFLMVDFRLFDRTENCKGLYIIKAVCWSKCDRTNCCCLSEWKLMG